MRIQLMRSAIEKSDDVPLSNKDILKIIRCYCESNNLLLAVHRWVDATLQVLLVCHSVHVVEKNAAMRRPLKLTFEFRCKYIFQTL